ncbi:hypothetical protein C8R47DRAFT_1086589 [Mycena vitilis]|nr:hypothetical protein C8R47DRAFT_1086589 [Mycena vitilis]
MYQLLELSIWVSSTPVLCGLAVFTAPKPETRHPRCRTSLPQRNSVLQLDRRRTEGGIWGNLAIGASHTLPTHALHGFFAQV